jgi:GPH family glycoside/pentoside/hexuronide:cation symporter
MMVVMTLNDLLYSMVALNVAALLPEMFPNLADRAGVNGWRQVMGLLGMLVGAALAPVLAARFGWPVAGIWLGGMLGLALLVSLAGIREHRVYAQARQPTLLPAVFGALRQPAFVIFLCLSFLGRLALTTLNATIPFYASYVLRLGPKGASLLLGAALVSALFTMGIWARLLARWGARRTLLVSQVMVGLAILPFLLLRSLPSAVTACVVVGGGLAGLLITPEVMLSDVIDADHAYTGQRHEGMHFGLTNLVNRLPNVFQAAVIGEILALTGFSVTRTVQPDSVVLGLRVLVGIIPSLAMASALVMAWIYPLHGAKLAGIRSEVTALRAVAERSEEIGVDDIPS